MSVIAIARPSPLIATAVTDATAAVIDVDAGGSLDEAAPSVRRVTSMVRRIGLGVSSDMTPDAGMQASPATA